MMLELEGFNSRTDFFFPGLYLPKIQLNQETEVLLKNLKYYEMCQREGQNEVRSFLGLMNKLIPTQEDIKHLSSKGILEISKPLNTGKSSSECCKICRKL